MSRRIKSLLVFAITALYSDAVMASDFSMFFTTFLGFPLLMGANLVLGSLLACSAIKPGAGRRRVYWCALVLAMGLLLPVGWLFNLFRALGWLLAIGYLFNLSIIFIVLTGKFSDKSRFRLVIYFSDFVVIMAAIILIIIIVDVLNSSSGKMDLKL